MQDYIPKLATIEQSCEWLRARLGGMWILPRLLECHLKPYFWIDFKPGYPQIFGPHVEGYLTHMVFSGDVRRLEIDGTNALVNMFTAHDGTLVKSEPGWIVPLSELRFKREAIERVASILEGEALRQKTAPSGAPKKATGGTTTHKLKTRGNVLNAVIDQAKREANAPDDYHSVWAALVRLADSKDRPAPLLGFAEEEGIKYQGSNAVQFFNKAALRKRMGR